MKYAEYQAQGYECMISRKFQNKNAAKVLDAEQTASLQVLLAHHNTCPTRRWRADTTRWPR